MGRDPSGRLPNLFLAGVSKAGTTSIFNYLGQHPDIATSDVKELRYFTPLRYGEPLKPIETYAAHFRAAVDHTIVLEATPGYFYGGRSIACAIDETCPSARIVVSLRSPEQRCWSWFTFVKSRLRIPKQMTFDEYLDRCEELHGAGVDGRLEHQAFWGLGGGCYAQWLDAWTTQFGTRLQIVFFDDLVADPRSAVTSICEWLGLETAPIADFDFTIDNKTEQYRNKHLQKAAVVANRHAESIFRRHPRAKRTLRRCYYALNRARSDPEMLLPSQRARLTEFYRPHNDRLADQLAAVGLRLPASWSTNDTGNSESSR